MKTTPRSHSRRRTRYLGPAAFLVLVALPACGGGANGVSGDVQPAASAPRGSSTVALTADDKHLLVVNPDADTVSIFDIVQRQPVMNRELAVGSDPRSVAVTRSGDKAYVANAASNSVSVIKLGSPPQVIGTIAVGTEPRAVVIADGDARVFVANSGDPSISVIDTATAQVIMTLKFEAALGREPRALAYRRDGADERLYAAAFFSELRPGKTGLDQQQDDSQEGRIDVFDARSLQLLGTVALGPMADTGFKSNGSVLDRVGTENGQGGTDAPDPTNPAATTFATGAYPNQLAAIGIHPRNGKAYVVSTGASPNGPFAFNVNVQGLVSVFDLATNTEVTGDDSATVHQKAPLNLNQGLNQDTNTRPTLFHSNPVAIAFAPNGDEAWIAVQNSDVIVRMTVDASGLPTIQAPVLSGAASIVRVDLQNPPAGLLAGKVPIGLAIDSTGTLAFVHNFVSRSVSVVDVHAQLIVATAATTPSPAPGTPDATVQLGAELFFSGRGPDGRMSAASWGSCGACHPLGLSDGVTWAFDAGPRQTIALDGMFNRFNGGDQRILNWSAVRDENQDFEQNTRGVSGGTGLVDDDRLVFVAGGVASGSTVDSSQVLQYQQARNQFSSNNDLDAGNALPALIAARRDFGMATLSDGRILIAGGRSGVGQGNLVAAADAVLLFDPRSNTITARTSTGFTVRHSFGLAAADTIAGPRVYAVGGYADTLAASAPVALVQEYDPALDRWRDVAPLPAAVAQFGIASNGPLNVGEPTTELNVLCGNTGSEAAPVLTGALRRFNPNPLGLGTWRTLGFAFTPRRNLGAAAVVRGVFPTHVFAIGGLDALDNALTTVEAFAATTSQNAPTDPAAAVTPLTSLPAARHSFAIGTSNNRVYVLGGIDDVGTDQTTVFELNPAANPAGGTAGPPGTPSGVWTAKATLPQTLRSAQASTPAPVANFLAAHSAGRDPRQDAIAEWIRRVVRSPVAPARGINDFVTTAGRELFGQPGLTGVAGTSCATCHGGAKWTRSTVAYTAPPSPDLGHGTEEVRGAELRRTLAQPTVLFDVGTFVPGTAGRLLESRPNPTDIGQRVNALGANGFNIPSLLGVAATAPYLHHGAAATLEAVLYGSQDGNGASPLRSVHHVTDAAQRDQLVAFLRTIDATASIFQ
jgi:YVTN family beta-propeller protein